MPELTWEGAHSVVVEGLLGADVGVVPKAETDEAEELYVVRLVSVHQRGGRAQVGDTIRLSHCNCLLVRLVVLRALVPLARRGTHELRVFVYGYRFTWSLECTHQKQLNTRLAHSSVSVQVRHENEDENKKNGLASKPSRPAPVACPPSERCPPRIARCTRRSSSSHASCATSPCSSGASSTHRTASSWRSRAASENHSHSH